MKVIISGYYGFGNLGDEAILRTLVSSLRESFPKIEIVVLSQTPESTSRRFGVRAMGRWNIFAVENELRSASLFISGGGGLLQDKSSWRSPLYYLALITLAKRHCPVVMLGQGIGPITRTWVRLLTWKAIQAVDFALVRDQSSLNELTAAGIDERLAASASDLVLLDWPDWESVRGAHANAQYLGVNLTKRLPMDARNHLAKQLDQIFETVGIQTLFLVFNAQEDRAVTDEVAAQMVSRPHVITPSLNETQACFTQLKYVIGMRLHALIFSTLASRPFISLTSDPKLEKLVCQLQKAGYASSEISSIDPDGLAHVDFVQLIARLELHESDLRARLTSAGLKLHTETQNAMSRSCREISSLLKLD